MLRQSEHEMVVVGVKHAATFSLWIIMYYAKQIDLPSIILEQRRQKGEQIIFKECLMFQESTSNKKKKSKISENGQGMKRFRMIMCF